MKSYPWPEPGPYSDKSPEPSPNDLRRALEKQRLRHVELEQAISWLRGRVRHLEGQG